MQGVLSVCCQKHRAPVASVNQSSSWHYLLQTIFPNSFWKPSVFEVLTDAGILVGGGTICCWKCLFQVACS